MIRQRHRAVRGKPAVLYLNELSYFAMSSNTIYDYSSLRCEWLWVYDAPVPTSDLWSKDVLVPPGVFFVLKGRGMIEADGQTLDLPAGTAFFSAPGLRRQWFEKGTRLLSVGFRATWPDGLPLFNAWLNSLHPASRLRKLHVSVLYSSSADGTIGAAGSQATSSAAVRRAVAMRAGVNATACSGVASGGRRLMTSTR